MPSSWTDDPLGVDRGLALVDASERMYIDNIRHLEKDRYGCALVADGDELLGIFTTTDALRAVRALATGRSAAAVTKPTHVDVAPQRALHVERKIRLGKLRPMEGAHFPLGHRLG